MRPALAGHRAVRGTAPGLRPGDLSSYFEGVSAADLDLVPDGATAPAARAAPRRGGRSRWTARPAPSPPAAAAASATTRSCSPPARTLRPAGARRDLPGCFVYRTLDDLDAIRAAAQQAAARSRDAAPGRPGRRRRAARPGGGPGPAPARDAAPCRRAGAAADAAAGGRGGGALLRALIENTGVTVHLGTSVRAIGQLGTAARHPRRRHQLDVDMVVFSAGVRPRDQLARDAGLAVGARGGVVVDEGCRTSDPAIYAIGECA